MRRVVLLAALAVVGAAPARANELNAWQELTFTAPVPCAVVCPYWLDDANADLDGNDKEDIYFQACASPDGTADALEGAPGLPYQEGTVFDDILVGPAPDGTLLLEVELWPASDWDGFICDAATGEELSSTAYYFECGNYENPLNYFGLACPEEGNIEAEPGARYILRAYNWADLLPLEGRYRFRN